MRAGRFTSKWPKRPPSGSCATAIPSRVSWSTAIKPRSEIGGLASGLRPSGKRFNLEKFLIFNQQFVTLIRAGLPILRALDLLAERLTDPKLSSHIRNVRDEVKSGSLLSDAFAKQGVFPPIYVTSVLAGERSGALAEVIERFVTYQKLALSVRKKLLVSLMYPGAADRFGRLPGGVPDHSSHLRGAELRRTMQSMQAQLPTPDPDSDRPSAPPRAAMCCSDSQR